MNLLPTKAWVVKLAETLTQVQTWDNNIRKSKSGYEHFEHFSTLSQWFLNVLPKKAKGVYPWLGLAEDSRTTD